MYEKNNNIKSFEEFYNIYKSEILPKLLKNNDFEKQRNYIKKETCQKAFILIFIIILISLFLHHLNHKLTHKDLLFILFSIEAVTVYIFYSYLYLKKAIKRGCYDSTKKEFTHKIFQALLINPEKTNQNFNNTIQNINFKTMDYNNKQNKENILLTIYNNKILNDTITGMINGIKFTISEVILEKIIQFKIYKYKTKVFKGCLINIPLENNFIGQTILQSNKNFCYYIKNCIKQTFEIIQIFLVPITIIFLFMINGSIIWHSFEDLKYTLYGIIILFLIFTALSFSTTLFKTFFNLRLLKKDNFKRIKSENSEFNKKYIAYTNNTQTNKYIIPPMLVENLLNLKLPFKHKGIKIVYSNNQLTILIQTDKNLFEFHNFEHPNLNNIYIRNFYDEITAVIHLIEHFKLDEKTGL